MCLLFLARLEIFYQSSLDLGHKDLLHVGRRLLLSIILHIARVLFVDWIGTASVLLSAEQVCHPARWMRFLVTHDDQCDRDGEPVKDVADSGRVCSCIVPSKNGIEDLVAISGVFDFWVSYRMSAMGEGQSSEGNLPKLTCQTVQ